MTRLLTSIVGTAGLALAACVTINVYFPAAAAEKAADRIIEDVWGKEQAAAPSEQAAAPSGNEQSALGFSLAEVMIAAARGVLEFVVPAAQAQADLNVSTPAVRTLTAQMEGRHAQLSKYYDSGAVGLTAEGLVELRDANAVPLAERNQVKKLVTDENNDRNALYREIASANNHPEWEADIRSTFAERWVAKARAGWWHRNAAGQWSQK